MNNKIKAGILALTLVVSLPTLASESIDVGICEEVEPLARSVMYARQNDMSLKRLMQILTESADSAPILGLARKLALDAYSQDNYATKEMKQKAINKFANQYYLACLSKFA